MQKPLDLSACTRVGKHNKIKRKNKQNLKKQKLGDFRSRSMNVKCSSFLLVLRLQYALTVHKLYLDLLFKIGSFTYHFFLSVNYKQKGVMFTTSEIGRNVKGFYLHLIPSRNTVKLFEVRVQ